MTVDISREVLYTVTIIKTFAGFSSRRQFSNSIYYGLSPQTFKMPECIRMEGCPYDYRVIF
jgi:hypothetical protein